MFGFVSLFNILWIIRQLLLQIQQPKQDSEDHYCNVERSKPMTTILINNWLYNHQPFHFTYCVQHLYLVASSNHLFIFFLHKTRFNFFLSSKANTLNIRNCRYYLTGMRNNKTQIPSVTSKGTYSVTRASAASSE